MAQPPRRTRYRLGAGGVVYVLFAGLLLGAAIYTQANLLFWSFGLMVGGLVVSLILSWQVMRRIRVHRLMPSHGVAGEPLIPRYQVHNGSWLPIFGLLITETWGEGLHGWKKAGPVTSQGVGWPTLLGQPIGWMLHLGPNQTGQAEAPCWPMIRGPLGFEQIVLSTAFPFNVIRKSIVFRQDQEVLIYPALYRVHRRLVHSLSRLDMWGRHQLDRGGGHEEFFGLREYRHGDRMTMIDWKRSASHGELISREMTHPSPPRVMLLLDLSPSPQPTEPAEIDAGSAKRSRWWTRPFRGRARTRPTARSDEQESNHPAAWLISKERAIGLAASLICDAYMNGFQVGLAVNGPPCPTFPPHHSLPHRTRMLEALARLELKPADPQTEPTATSPIDPTMIITTERCQTPDSGPAPLSGGPRTAPLVLYADQLDQYVTDADRDALLSRHVRSPSRRDTLAEQAP